MQHFTRLADISFDDIFFLNCQYEQAVQETNAVIASLMQGV